MVSQKKNINKVTSKPCKDIKDIRTTIMYEKGLEFIGASILLKQYKGKTYPQIHLLLQGLEIILKSLLLRKDYDKYSKQLKEKYGHNLLKLVNEVKINYRFKNIDNKFDIELNSLQNNYMNSNLRYGSILDIFIDVKSLSIETIESKIYQLVRIIEAKKLNNLKIASA
jgi:hypothetical protein